MELVQAQDTIHTETLKVSTDHTQKVICRNICFILIFQSSMQQRDV